MSYSERLNSCFGAILRNREDVVVFADEVLAITTFQEANELVDGVGRGVGICVEGTDRDVKLLSSCYCGRKLRFACRRIGRGRDDFNLERRSKKVLRDHLAFRDGEGPDGSNIDGQNCGQGRMGGKGCVVENFTCSERLVTIDNRGCRDMETGGFVAGEEIRRRKKFVEVVV